MASDLLLKPAERKRLEQVRVMLAEGTSPYAYITNGGAAPDLEELRKSYNIKLEPSKDRIQELEAKWSARPVEADDLQNLFPDLESLGEPDGPRIPGHIYCSFCGKEAQRATATVSTKPQVSFKDEIVREELGNGQVLMSLESKAIYRAKKVIACPDCAGETIGLKTEFSSNE